MTFQHFAFCGFLVGLCGFWWPFPHPLLSQLLSGRWLWLLQPFVGFWLWLPASSASPVPLRNVYVLVCMPVINVFYVCMYVRTYALLRTAFHIFLHSVTCTPLLSRNFAQIQSHHGASLFRTSRGGVPPPLNPPWFFFTNRTQARLSGG